MERREFLSGVASLPIVSVPSGLASSPNEDSENEDHRELSALWEGDTGHLTILKNGDVEAEWTYEEHSTWHSAVRWIGRSIFDFKYVVDALRVDLEDIYITSTFFHSILRGNGAEVRARRGKYSNDKYRYYVRTPEREEEYGADDYTKMVVGIQDKVIDDEVGR